MNCTWKDCTRPLYAVELCATHYKRKIKGRPMDAPVREQKQCSLDGCDNTVYSSADVPFCVPHKYRKASGDTSKLKHQGQDQCSFDGCTNIARSNELCATHYRQSLRGGELKPIRVKKVKGMTPCVPWPGHINADGYGKHGGKLAHRVMWEQVHGAIPDGMTIDHKCHDPELCQLSIDCPHRRCVNVDHMELVTPEENRERKYHQNSLVTHCPKGHPYSGENLGQNSHARWCKKCKRESNRKHRSKK